MNKQGPGKIDWTDYTWNPISGCLHGCDYCYMRRMEKRFPAVMKPAFHPERLMQPAKVKKPSFIFTGSSGDMWGEWVDERHIRAVLKSCEDSPQHTFQFLTKNPGRYMEFKPLENCWYGTTVDGTDRTKTNDIKLFYPGLGDSFFDGMRFVSFEPLLKPVYSFMEGIDWIIIGADSTRGAKKPPKEWADRLIDQAREMSIPVWVKDNYGYPRIIKERPWTN